jgi:transcriptional regulator with XRE-family HTH domain
LTRYARSDKFPLVPITLKTARKIKGITQDELSALSGVPQSTIAKIEKGRTRDLTWTTASRLAAALGVEPSEIFAMPAPRTQEATR